MRITEKPEKRFLLKDIRQKIKSGELKPGEKLLSTQELAQSYGVAVQTAHRWLNELVKEGLLSRRKGVGTIVQAPKIMNSGIIGLIMMCRGDIWGDFASRITSGLQERAINTLIIDDSSNSQSPSEVAQLPVVRQLISSAPLAIITQDMDLAKTLTAVAPGTRIICISGESTDTFAGDIICPDLFYAGYMAAKHLIDRGYKRISFYKIKSPEKTLSTNTKCLLRLCEGYKKAINEAGLQEDVFVDATDGRDDMGVFCEKLSAKTMEAIFVHFDFRAFQFIQKAKELGCEVPRDLAVVSAFNTPWAESLKLTSIDFHYDFIADKCVQTILESLDKKNEPKCHQILKFKPELIIANPADTA